MSTACYGHEEESLENAHQEGKLAESGFASSYRLGESEPGVDDVVPEISLSPSARRAFERNELVVVFTLFCFIHLE